MSVRAFGVKNLRCLKDTGLLKLKPITLLVGKNSSGKSTYLRTFPLFRQSLETPRSSPILWFHPGYVDFGTLQEAVNRQADPRQVTFEVEVEIPAEARIAPPGTPARVALSLMDDNGSTRVSGIDMVTGERCTELRFDVSGKLASLEVGHLAGGERTPLLPAGLDVWQSGPVSWLPTLSSQESRGVSYVRHIVEDRSRWDLRSEVDGTSLAGFAMVPKLLQAVDLLVGDFMSGVSYLAPIRSEGARFHRLMDLAVEEIDARGENLAMFLKSLSRDELTSFAEFTERHLGFRPDLRIQGMQAEILVSDPDVPSGVNLIDVGFGYSQVLPLVAMVWSACVRPSLRKRRRPTLLAFEQPELHMHPSFQAKLAAMLVHASDESRSGGERIPMMIETHSQALVNGLGFLIEEKKLEREDVQVVLFEPHDPSGGKGVRVVEYDADGNLIDWPYGFFASSGGD